METFADVQERLAAALEANRPGSGTSHVVVALPSYSVGESLLSHYADRIPALEHRYLLASLMLARIPGCQMVFLSCDEPGREVVEYYASLTADPESVRQRFVPLVVPDASARSVAAKLLDRPDLLEQLRRLIGDRPAVIEPWNVKEHEVEVAVQLGVPVNGTPADLWSLGFKSAGRRLFRDAGVPLPYGHEDVRTVDDAVAAIVDIAASRPAAPGAVIKHDDSGAGDGNAVIRFDRTAGVDTGWVRRQVEALDEWFLDDLRRGGVVEELIAGARFTSPSAQIDMQPSGAVAVLATHEQVLGGADGQVYGGCRFPADAAYAARLAEHASAVGKALARAGAAGRASVDFAAAADESGEWEVYALEVNLRKGGTTHPFTVLRHLVPGRYDAATGQWLAEDGTPRVYEATDNLVDPAWLGLAPALVIDAVAAAGLQFDRRSGTGVVLHMLSCLAIDGRCGLTAIGRDGDHAADLVAGTRAAIDSIV